MIKLIRAFLALPYNYGTTFGQVPYALKKVDGQWVQLTSTKSRLAAYGFWSFMTGCAVFYGWQLRKQLVEDDQHSDEWLQGYEVGKGHQVHAFGPRLYLDEMLQVGDPHPDSPDYHWDGSNWVPNR